MPEDTTESAEADPINRTSYTLRFNAPALRFADHSHVPGKDLYSAPREEGLPQTLFPESGDLIGMSRKDVLSRKAWFAPDTTYESDWSDNEDDTVEGEGVDFWARLDNFNNAGLSDVWNFAWSVGESFFGSDEERGQRITPNTMFPDGKKYGFRFMYNPAVLQFNVGLATGVNTSYIFSGAATAAPSGVSSTNSSIGVSFPISRIEDLAIMEQVTGQTAWNASSGVRVPPPGEPPNQTRTPSAKLEELGRLQRLYASAGLADVSIPGVNIDNSSNMVAPKDIIEIATRGTMYDLDFLFRTVLGRQWKTFYRGYTADVGLAFSVPLVLYLSPTMIYRVRLGSIGFTHKMFTPNMIPTYTEVTLGFERIPDVVGWSPAPGGGTE